jgi:hypothetical protein
MACLTDAFKINPACKVDWRLQGFSWLSRFFVELRMVFGAVTAVCNFDRLGNTLRSLIEVSCAIPRAFLGRTFDDFTAVGPKRSGWCKQFKSVCKRLNIQLAANCPNNEKAFENQTIGVVLGIKFRHPQPLLVFPKRPGRKAAEVHHRRLQRRPPEPKPDAGAHGVVGERLCPNVSIFESFPTLCE